MVYKEGDLSKLLSGGSVPIVPPTPFDSKSKDVIEEVESVDEDVVDSTMENKTPRTKLSRKQKAMQGKVSEEDKRRTIFVGNYPVSQFKKARLILKRLAEDIAKFELPPSDSDTVEIAVDKIYIRSVPIKPVKAQAGTNYKEVIANSVKSGSFDTRNPLVSCHAYIVLKAAESVPVFLQKVRRISNSEGGPSLVVDKCLLRFDMASKSKEEREFDKKRTIFVGNLPFTVSEQEVIDYFTEKLAGQIEKKPKERDFVKAVRLIRDRVTTKGKGIGYILLGERRYVKLALRLNNSKFGKRNIRVDFALSKEDVNKKKQKNSAPVKPNTHTKRNQSWKPKKPEKKARKEV